MVKTLRVGFVRALWHREIVDQACLGYEADMKAAGIPHETTFFEVPGAFEMPLLAKQLGQTGAYDAVVAAAFVVDGGITVGPPHSWNQELGGPILDALGITPEQAEQMAEAMRGGQGS